MIGDPVNEAARLTNHAKQVEGRVVANQDLVDRATDDEGRRWTELEPITVRGRRAPTRLAAPCPDGG